MSKRLGGIIGCKYKTSSWHLLLLLLLLLLFLTVSVLVANPKKILYTVANTARGLLYREKRTNEKVIVWYCSAPPSLRCSLLIGENNVKKNMCIERSSAWEMGSTNEAWHGPKGIAIALLVDVELKMSGKLVVIQPGWCSNVAGQGPKSSKYPSTCQGVFVISSY